MKLNKKQKRTATIASMAALLAVVLGMGGQTFAKYITTQDVADQATVAKWGVVITNGAAGSFSNSYDSTVVSKTEEGTSSNFRDVVAPGTSGSFDLFISGAPEVSAKVEVSLSIEDIFLTSSELPTPTVAYYPIVWTVTKDGETETFNGKTAAADIEDYVKIEEEYEVGTAFETNITIEWAWAFENKGEDANKHIVDEYDTILGDIAAGEGNYYSTEYTSNITLDVALNAKVSQID